MAEPRTPLARDVGPVLVVMTDHHIGNFVVSAPVLARLADYFGPHAHMLVDARYVGLAQLLLPGVRVSGAARKRGLKGTLALASTIRQTCGRFRAAIDVAGNIRSATVTGLSLARVRVGLNSHERRWAYNELLRNPANGPHTVDQYARLLGAIHEFDTPPPLQLQPDAIARCAPAGEPYLDRYQRFAVVHAGAGKSHRLWPADRFAQVIDALHDRGLDHVYLIGAPFELDALHALRETTRTPERSTVLQLPLESLLALFDRAALLVCNESGPMHLAALTRCPIVAIYGPTRPEHWRPYRHEAVATLRGDPCPPGCAMRGCFSDGLCLTTLSVDTVLDAVNRMLPAPT